MRSLLLSILGTLLLSNAGSAFAAPTSETSPRAQAPSEVAPLVIAPKARVRAPAIETSPKVWVELKDFVYERLPSHRGRNFKAVLVGMSFDTPDETIAALGLEGSWL